MTSVPLKPQYGPTLGALLAPRWHKAGRAARAATIAAVLSGAVLVVGAVLTLWPASAGHGGRVPFSFSYRGLRRTSPNPGGYLKLERSQDGRLEDSFAVAPLALAPYTGSVTGELPIFAASYVRRLAARFESFKLEREGKTRISSSLQGYDVVYSVVLDGRHLSGRDVMLLRSASSAREGVVIEMLTSEPATISKPAGSSGVLERPLKTFAFG